MKKKLIWIAVPIVLFVFWMGMGTGNDQEAYEKQILKEIEERKTFLKSSAGSPFEQYDEPYREPTYFPVNRKYQVNARVERIPGRSSIQIANNEGDKETYTRFAWLHFSIDGQKQKLLVLKPIGFGDPGYLFLAFADETSAVETYGAGRYLEVEIGKSDKTVLDFNLAYNPYCAYVDGYTCPLPPPENLLTVAIRAGEKDFK